MDRQEGREQEGRKRGMKLGKKGKKYTEFVLQGVNKIGTEIFSVCVIFCYQVCPVVGNFCNNF